MGLSVIVPVYNGEKYIEDCLNSIINQTYKNLQIIVVNDGSTDNTKSILSDISKKDSRIQVIDKENGGVSSARNVGLEHATEDCITFVDDDDTVDLDMYELLMNYIAQGYDIAHCGYKKISKEKVKLVNGTGKVITQNNVEALECLISGRLFVGSLCNKVYKRSLFKCIRLDETLKINEDVLMNYQVFKNSKKTIFIDEAKYNYFERDESSCKNTNSIKKWEDCLKVAEIISNDCKETYLHDIALNKYIGALIVLYRVYYYSKDINCKKNLKHIRKHLKSFYKKKHIIGRKNKISSILIIYLPYIYGLLYKVYDKIRVPNWDVNMEE